jgi:hypothetical protein
MMLERRRSPRWRRRGIRLLLPVLAAPVLLVSLADLWLSCPWGRAWVGGRISHRLGLPAKVGAIRWTPWEGLVIHGFEIGQPGPGGIGVPLLKTGSIEIDPDWPQILRGKKVLKRICVNDPDIVVTSEALLALSSSAKPPEATALAGQKEPAPVSPEAVVPSVPVQDVPPAATSNPPAIQSAVPPEVAQNPPQSGVSPPKEDASPPTAAAEPEAVRSAPPDLRPPLQVEIRRGRFRFITSPDREPLAELAGLSVSVPIQGPDSTGSLSISGIELGGRPLASALELPLQWRSPEIRMIDQPVKLAGLDLQVSLRFVRFEGLPFLVDLKGVPQPLPPWDGPLDRKIDAGRVEISARCIGAVLAPSTWQGNALAAVEDLRLAGADRAAIFRRGDAAMFLAHGLLHCPDIRLIGDESSFLGNGSAGGGSPPAAVLRWVMPADAASGWVQRIKTLDPTLQPHFLPIETPDRYMIDLGWVSSGPAPGVELGSGGPVLPLPVFLSLFSGTAEASTSIER